MGEDKVWRDMLPSMGGEDFSFMLQAKPGAYIRIGQGLPHGPGPHPLHNSRYDFNDDILPLGAALHASLVEQALAPERCQEQFMIVFSTFFQPFQEFLCSMLSCQTCSVALAASFVSALSMGFAHAATVRMANQGDALSMDPHSLNESLATERWSNNVYESLVGVSKLPEIRSRCWPRQLEANIAHRVAF